MQSTITKRLLIAITITTALIAGCVKVKTIPYESAPRAPKPADFPIEIIDPHDIDRPYKVIGMVQVNAGKKHSVEDILEKLRDAARQMGADALLGFDSQPVGVAVPSQGGVVYSGHVRELWRTKAIVWE